MESRHPKGRVMVDIIKAQQEQVRIWKIEHRRFRDALFGSLVHLKPKYCLEIGTHIGQSTEVFQKYFDEHQPDGVVVTVEKHTRGAVLRNEGKTHRGIKRSGIRGVETDDQV